MQSEQHHIDDFFRNKEEANPADLSRIDSDWNNMQNLLSQPAVLSPGKHKSIRPRHIIWAAIASGVLVTSAILYSSGTKHKSPSQPEVSIQKNETRAAVQDTTKKILFPANTADTSFYVIKPVYSGSPTTAFIYADHADSLPRKKDTISINTVTAAVPDNSIVFTSFFSSIEKKAEIFVLHPEADTQLVCHEGTRLHIPAGSFCKANGEPVNGPVEFSVVECYAYSDIFSQKLFTLSGNKLLGSGGMLRLTARSQGEDLRLTTGSSVGVQMPLQKFNPEMQLFRGVNSTTLDIGNQLQVKKDTIRLQAVNVETKDTISLMANSVSMPPLDITLRSNSISTDWILEGQQQAVFDNKKKIIRLLNITDNPSVVTNYKHQTKTKGKFTLPYKSDISAEDMKELLEQRYGAYYDKIQVRQSRRPLFGRKNMSKEESDWYESMKVGDTIRVPLAIAMRMKLINREDSIAYEAQFKKQLEDAIRLKQNYQEWVELKSEYSFSITGLGWINCDHYLNYPKSRLTDYYVNADTAWQGNYMQAMAIIRSDKACMPGNWQNGKLYFPNLPLGTEIDIVCTLAKEGKMYACFKSTKVERDPVMVSFEAVTPESFREKMNQYGRLN